MVLRNLKLPKDRSFFLFGPRQVGKTTLLKSSFEKDKSAFYDLLDSDLYLKFVARPALFTEEINKLDSKISHVLVDEIQRIPDLLNEVHRIIESDKPRVFVLSGSSARKLKKQGANMLAGRALSYKLYPLTYEELGEDFDLQKALELGTLPAVYLDDSLDYAKETLYSYVTTYLEQEVKLEAQVRNLGPFVRFLSLAASENGKIINYSNIANDIFVDYKTVQDYYQVLEDTLIGFFLPAYAKSSRKQLSKSPKFYFFDTGVQRAIYKKLESPLIPQTQDYGDSFEHFFIAEIMRLAHYKRKQLDFSYYRTKDGAEVDLIIERPDAKCFAIEIKSSQSVKLNKLKGLKSFSAVRGDAELMCASNSTNVAGNHEISIYPWREVIDRVLQD